MNIHDILETICLVLGCVALIQFIYMNHISITEYWTGEDRDEKK